MDSRLFMEIGFENTTFQAIDRSPYERWINDGYLDNSHDHVKIQRLISMKDGDDNTSVNFQKTIESTIDGLRNPYQVEHLTNGIYYYQKLLLPTQDHVGVVQKTLWYDVTDNLVHHFNVSTEIEQVYDPENDFDDIYTLVRKEYPDNCFFFDDYSFTIYDLIRCYILTERERINNYLKNNCSGNCSPGPNNLDAKADILLATIMVIKDLIEKGDYFEAQRILNGLNTCGSLCSEFANELKGCGCGGS